MSHEHLWQQSAEHPRLPTLDRDVEVDVCIVGAGITGLTLAHRLGEEGLKVAVIEARQVGSGATGHTSAHLTWYPDRPLHVLRREVGRDRLATLLEAGREAIELIEDIGRGLGLDDQLERVPGWRYCEDGQEDDLAEEAAELRALGLPVVMTPQTPLPFPVRHAMRVEDQAMFHPLRYLYGLCTHLPKGVQVYERTRLTDWSDGEPCEVITDRGRVRAAQVVFATHTPPGRLLRVQARVAPYRTCVVALRLTAPMTPGLFWDTADPYHYIRPFSPHELDMVLVGGGDHRPGDGDEEAVADDLEAWARQRFPVRERVSAWGHEVFEPSDGLPYIGRLPGERNVWVATGFSGTGLTLGTASAMLIGELMQGRTSAWADAFSPARLEPLRSAGRMVRENIDNAVHFFADRLRPGGSHDVSDLQPGQGRIVQEGVRKLAVYRDQKGELHALSPVCSHAGCVVGWNGADRTWDCPCHGGRYAADGTPLYGPPLGPLARRSLEEEEVG